jgi:hypothetical protein
MWDVFNHVCDFQPEILENGLEGIDVVQVCGVVLGRVAERYRVEVSKARRVAI